MFFDNIDGLLRVLLVSVCAYAALVLILRVTGKRTLAKLNAFDFVVTVAFGSTLATILLSNDVALAEGVLALAMLALLQYVVAKTSLWSDVFRKFVRSDAVLLVEDGRYCEGAMTDERITQSEIDSVIRNHGIGRISEVAAVVLETDGSFSVIRQQDKGELTSLRSVRRP